VKKEGVCGENSGDISICDSSNRTILLNLQATTSKKEEARLETASGTAAYMPQEIIEC
jgi:hypothetical protein